MSTTSGAAWDRVLDIPSQSRSPVLEALRRIGSEWSGQGVAVECGCWLGATSAALVTGLVRAGYRKPLYCYDNWTANEIEVTKAKRYGVALEVGANLEPVFRCNVRPFYRKLRTRRGKIQQARWRRKPIEIFLLDAVKREPHFSNTLSVFGPAWIPGVTRVALLDYYYYEKSEGDEREFLRCQERFLEAWPGHFERIERVGSGGIFQYTKALPWGEASLAR